MSASPLRCQFWCQLVLLKGESHNPAYPPGEAGDKQVHQTMQPASVCGVGQGDGEVQPSNQLCRRLGIIYSIRGQQPATLDARGRRHRQRRPHCHMGAARSPNLLMPNPFVGIHFCGHRLYKRAKMAKIVWSWIRTPQTRFNVGLHGLRPSKWPPNISMRESRRRDYAIPTTAYLRSS